jgi:hypothetical protein
MYVRFQVLTAGGVKFRVFWDVASCISLMYTDVSEMRTASIIADYEGSTHLCNVSPLQRDYTVLYPRRLNFKAEVIYGRNFIYTLCNISEI